MKCKKARKLLPAMAAGELPESKAGLLREHLDECSSCAADYKIYEESASALKRSRDRSIPDGLWDGYWERIREEAVRPQAGGVRRVALSWRAAFGLAAAAAIIAVVFGGLAILHKKESPSGEEKEQPLMVKGIIAPSDSTVVVKKDVPRVYVLTDMSKRDLRSKLIQPLPDSSRTHKLDRHYALKQVTLTENDESKYEF